MQAIERDEHEGTCPRCGAEARWSFLDEEKRQIEVMCEDCGRFEITREEFDEAAIENAELREAERG
jgi:transcription elongation factor Elf1